MGSSGMKRKGRRHLPKVGTPAERQHELEERRELAMHPFSGDPRPRTGSAAWLTAIVVGIIVFIGVLAIIVAT
jgi:hypothetical protein